LPPYVVMDAAGAAEESSGLHQSLWLLTIWGAVLPATILVLLVQALGDRIAPGYGTITAVTLGVSTLLLPFATMFFAHALTAALAFAAFALVWPERKGQPAVARAAGAGAL